MKQTAFRATHRLAKCKQQSFPQPGIINNPFPSESLLMPSVCSTSFSTCSSPAASQSTPPSIRTADYTKQRETLHFTLYDLFPSTLSRGPPPSGPFSIDLGALRQEFLRKQQSTHPDTVPTPQKKRAEAASAQLNKAYATLTSPLLRAQYLLSLRGIKTGEDDEAAKIDDQELVLEVFEAGEAIENAEDEDEIQLLAEENQLRIKDCEKAIEEAFAKDHLSVAKRQAVRLKFWKSVEQALHNWEKGKPVVLIH